MIENCVIQGMPMSYSIALIGGTGSGKSIVANVLSGRAMFPVTEGFHQASTTVRQATWTRNAVTLQLAEIPDFVNLGRAVGKLDVPQPDAVLVTIPCNERFVPEHYVSIHSLLRMIPNGSSDRSILAFTRTEQLGSEFSVFLASASPYLQDLLEEVDHRYICFSVTSDGHSQLDDLVRLIREARRSIARRRKFGYALTVWALICVVVWYYASELDPKGDVPFLQSSYSYLAAVACPVLIFHFRKTKIALRQCWRKVKAWYYSAGLSRMKATK